MTISKHIAVFAFPYGTHAAPILHLVRMLANSNPSVRFSFFTTAKSKISLFSGQDPGNIRAYEISDGLPAGFVSTGEVEKLVEYFLKAAPESFKNGVEAAEADAGEKVSGLLTDAFLWFSGEMAAAMGVPWVAFWTAGSVSISVHLYNDLIRSMYKKNGMHIYIYFDILFFNFFFQRSYFRP